eukprot:1609388-Ditylum_brightwellii.AAC.1
MGGLDVADQCIYYYMPNHCYHRNWTPMFLQLLAIIRSNWYAVRLEHNSPKKDGHKLFTLSIIQDLVDKASVLEVQESSRIPTTLRFHTAYTFTSLLVSSPSLNNHVTMSTSVSLECTRLL